MDRRWRSIIAQELLDSSSPVAKAEDLASLVQTPLASLPQPPPTASMTIGMNVMPCARHWERVSLWLYLKSSYLAHTWSAPWLAWTSESTRSPLVTAKSQAAGGPDCHLGIKTSARTGTPNLVRRERCRSRTRLHRKAAGEGALLFLTRGEDWQSWRHGTQCS